MSLFKIKTPVHKHTPLVQTAEVGSTNLPNRGYFIVDSVSATRPNWKEHAVAWYAYDYMALEAQKLNDLSDDDFIVLNADGSLYRA